MKRLFSILILVVSTVALLASCGGGGGGGASGTSLSTPAFTNLAGTQWSETDTVKSGTNSCGVVSGVTDTFTLHVLSQSGNTISVYDERGGQYAGNGTISGYVVVYSGNRYAVGGCSNMTANYSVTLNSTETGYTGSATITCEDNGCTVPVNVSATIIGTPPPSPPTGLTATGVSGSEIDLSWNASPSSGVTGYNIYMNGSATKIGYVTGLLSQVTGLSQGTSYCFTVSAYNAANIESAQSSQACTSTTGSPPPSTYTVTYNGNGNTGGSAPTDPNTHAPGATVTVLGNTGSLVKTGFTFAGWNTLANGTGTTYTQGQTFTMGSANVTLYAKWTAAQVCTPNRTSCVAGNVGVMQTCNPSGTAWVQSNCSGWQACTNGACRNLCGLTADPSVPTACFSPINDGVNTGPVMYWNDNRMTPVGSTTYTIGGATKDGQPNDANVYQDASRTWPYYWQFNGLSSQALAYVEFTLWQFGSSPRTVTISASARDASQVYGARFTGAAWLNSTAITPSGLLLGTAPAYWTNVSLSCTPGSSTCNSSFFGYTYAAGINLLGISNTGTGYGLPADDIQVNWVMLQVQ